MWLHIIICSECGESHALNYIFFLVYIFTMPKTRHARKAKTLHAYKKKFLEQKCRLQALGNSTSECKAAEDSELCVPNTSLQLPRFFNHGQMYHIISKSHLSKSNMYHGMPTFLQFPSLNILFI